MTLSLINNYNNYDDDFDQQLQQLWWLLWSSLINNYDDNDYDDNDYDDHQSILAGQLDEQVQLLVIKLNLKLLGNLLQKYINAPSSPTS